MLTINAYAKINLTLEVLGRREDGYHNITSVMQTIDLCDEISLVESDRVTLRSNLSSLETPSNLVLKAADILKEHTGYSGGAEIYLNKYIPMSSGLGGGSSDAAATLKALVQLWQLSLPKEELSCLAGALGSDVTYFIIGNTAIVNGRGEQVQQLPPLQTEHLVVVAPTLDIPNKTANMYANLGIEEHTDGETSVNLRRCIEERGRPSSKLLFNAFEAVAFRMFPPLDTYREQMLNAGAHSVHLAGSGPAMYSLVSSKRKAMVMASKLRRAGYRAYATSTIGSR